MMGGDTFDDSLKSAMEYCKKNNNIFVHAFDDDKTIEG
jgi:threonine dehydratase